MRLRQMYLYSRRKIKRDQRQYLRRFSCKRRCVEVGGLQSDVRPFVACPFCCILHLHRSRMLFILMHENVRFTACLLRIVHRFLFHTSVALQATAAEASLFSYVRLFCTDFAIIDFMLSL